MADEPKRVRVHTITSQPPAAAEQRTQSNYHLPKAPKPREHPEKPNFDGGAFKIVDDKFVRVHDRSLPYPQECVSFLIQRLRESKEAWQNFIDKTMSQNETEDWLYPINELCFSYYPESGSGGGDISQIVREVLGIMEHEARADPASYRAEEVRAQFDKYEAVKEQQSKKLD